MGFSAKRFTLAFLQNLHILVKNIFALSITSIVQLYLELSSCSQRTYPIFNIAPVLAKDNSNNIFPFLGTYKLPCPSFIEYVQFAFACFGELIATGPVDRVLSFCTALLFSRPEMTSLPREIILAVSNLHFINQIVQELFP